VSRAHARAAIRSAAFQTPSAAKGMLLTRRNFAWDGVKIASCTYLPHKLGEMSPVPQFASFGRNSWGTPKEFQLSASTSSVSGVHLGSLQLEPSVSTDLATDSYQWSTSMADDDMKGVHFEEEDMDSGSDKERVETSGRGGKKEGLGVRGEKGCWQTRLGQHWEESSSRAL
jgi:hypothetical protein